MTQRMTFSDIKQQNSNVYKRLFKEHDKYDEGDPSRLRTYNTIPDDEAWKVVDTTLREHLRDDMVIANDIRQNSSLVNDYNDLGKRISQWYDIETAVGTNVSMSGQPKGKSGGANPNVNAVPIPIFRADWNMPMRNYKAFQNSKYDIVDTRMIAEAGYQLGKDLEDVYMTGSDITVNDNGIPGLFDIVDSAGGSGTQTEAWDGTFDSDLIGDIEDDVQDILEDCTNKGAPETNSVNLYIPKSYKKNLTKTINDQNSRTLMDIIEEKPAVKSVKVAPYLDTSVLAIHISERFMSVERASSFVNVEWEPEGEMIHNWASLGAEVLRLTPSGDDKIPVVRYTES